MREDGSEHPEEVIVRKQSHPKDPSKALPDRSWPPRAAAILSAQGALTAQSPRQAWRCQHSPQEGEHHPMPSVLSCFPELWPFFHSYEENMEFA